MTEQWRISTRGMYDNGHSGYVAEEMTFLSTRDSNYGETFEESIEHTVTLTRDNRDDIDVTESECILCCCLSRNKKRKARDITQRGLTKLFLITILVGFLVYVGFALYLNPSHAIFICVVAPLVIYIVLNSLTENKLKRCLGRTCHRLKRKLNLPKRILNWTRRILTVAALVGIVAFLVFDIWDDFERWQPLGGLALFLFITFVFSKHPTKVNWVCVIWGLVLQFSMGLIILRWRTGFVACKWFGLQATTFLSYTDTASEFVFGEKYTDHPIVFKILPVVVFYSAFVSCLYYVGAMQTIIKIIAVFLKFAQRTTPIESFATAVHIFLGQVESSVTLKPFFSKLTLSELHAVMTSGFATVAGTMIAAYVEFGVPAEHVISASFMSAPAALAIAKLSYPETQQSKIKTLKEIKVPKGREKNIIEALANGATDVVTLVAYVVVNVIAFFAILAFLDAVLSYLGGLVNYPQLSFQVICSYVFMPLAAAMGIPWSETKLVGALIGKKIMITEFLAYADLGALLKEGSLSGKSAVLAAYSLCGFGSLVSLGIYLGSLVSNAPERRSDFAKLLLRSMINGNISSFMTACIAGLLYQDHSQTDLMEQSFNSTANITLSAVQNTTLSTLQNSTMAT